MDKYKPLVENLFLLSYQNAMKLMSKGMYNLNFFGIEFYFDFFIVQIKDMAYFHNHTDVVEQYCTCLAKVYFLISFFLIQTAFLMHIN